MRSRRLQLGIGVFLWLFTARLYLPTVRHDFVAFDDPDYVSANPWLSDGLTRPGLVRTFTEPYFFNWTPLTTLSYSADYRLYGLWPGGYLLTNLLLHATATMLLFVVLVRLTGATGRSALVAAVFGIHPLHVESVAWISERKDVLSGVFFMGVLWTYSRYAELRNTGRYAWVLALFILGLLSKPMLVTAPFVLLLLDVWPLGRVPLDQWERGLRSLRSLSIEKAPLFLLSVGSGYATYLAQKSGGTITSLDQLPIAQRLLNLPVAYCWYLTKSLWPSGLAFFYPFDWTHLTGSSVAVATGVLVSLSCGAFLAIRRATYLAVGWLWFLGMLVPVIGIVQVGRQSWADRYAYLPLVGIEIALVWGAWELARRLRIPKAPLLAGAASSCVALLVVTQRQIATWQNGLTLAQHAIDAGFESAEAHLMAASAYLQYGLLSDTHKQIDIAMRLDPSAKEPRLLLGRLRQIEGDFEGAATEYWRLLPEIPGVRVPLADALIQLGRYDEALAVLTETETSPLEVPQAEKHLEIGLALAGKGDFAGAIQHYRTAIEMRPTLSRAHLNLGWALTRTGQLRDGEEQLRKVLNAVRDPADAHAYLAENLQLQGRLNDAVASWRVAVSLRPDWLEANKNLAWLLATAADPSVRRPDEAVALAEAMAGAAGANDPTVLDTLAAAYAAAGRRGDAVRAARQALALAQQAGRLELSASILDHLHHYENSDTAPVTPSTDGRAR